MKTSQWYTICIVLGIFIGSLITIKSQLDTIIERLNVQNCQMLNDTYEAFQDCITND